MVDKETLNGNIFKKHKQNDKSFRILLVEDDLELNLVIKILLGRLGYEVISTSNGRTALNLYNTTFDLVITDLVMPEMGGVELIQRLRDQNPEVKCIAITGFSNLEIPEGIPVLNKPFSTTLLLQNITEVLNSQIKAETQKIKFIEKLGVLNYSKEILK